MKTKRTPGGLVLRAFHFLLTSISGLVSHSLNLYQGFLYVLPGFLSHNRIFDQEVNLQLTYGVLFGAKLLEI